MRNLVSALLVCVATGAAAGKDKPTYDLRPERLLGRTVAVEEQVVFDESTKKKQGAETNQWDDRWRKLSATYTEKVVSLEPLKVERTYEQCTHATGKANVKAKEPRKDEVDELAFHERSVELEDRSSRLRFDRSEFKLSLEQERDALLATRLLRALLPSEKVKKGGKWKPDAEAVRLAYFGRERKAKDTPIKASGKLVKVSEKKGQRLAELKFTIQLGERERGKAPRSYKLVGEAVVDLFERVVLGFQLKGMGGSETTERTTRGGFSKRKVRITTLVEEKILITRKATLVESGGEEPVAKAPRAEESGAKKAKPAADPGPKDGSPGGKPQPKERAEKKPAEPVAFSKGRALGKASGWVRFAGQKLRVKACTVVWDEAFGDPSLEFELLPFELTEEERSKLAGGSRGANLREGPHASFEIRFDKTVRPPFSKTNVKQYFIHALGFGKKDRSKSVSAAADWFGVVSEFEAGPGRTLRLETRSKDDADADDVTWAFSITVEVP